MKKGTVISRGNKWAVVINLGRQPAQRCSECVNGRAKVFWVDEKRHTRCPRCGGKLEDIIQRRREWHSGFDTKEDAEDELIRILGKHLDGTNVTPEKMTIKDFLEGEWLPVAEGYAKPSTFANYTHQLRSYVIPRIGHIKLQKLRTPDLNKLYTDLLRNGRTQGEGGLSKKSVRNVHACVRKALQDATDWAYIIRNPAVAAKVPVPDRRKMQTWSPSDVARFLEAEKDSRWLALWRLLATTGMRRGEAIGLSWDALDLEQGVLSVEQSIVNVSNVPVLQHDTKTDSGRRTVSLDPVTVRTLRRHRAHQAAEALEAGEAWDNEHNLAFTDELGRMLKPERVTRHFNSMVAKHDLPKIRLHDLRHSWASHALANNVHPKVVQERLGHGQLAVTMDTYSHVVPGMDQDAANRVADLYG